MTRSIFTHSEYFGQDIYISPNNNVYCLYPFGDIKLLIMDMDMTSEEVLDWEHFNKTTNEVLVYWMFVDDYMSIDFKKSIVDIIELYEKDSKTFFEMYNTKERNN